MLTKRSLILSTLGMASAPIVPRALAASLPTPPASEGPFFPRAVDLKADRDNDLVRVAGAVREAGGEVLHLGGVVGDAKGNRIAGAKVEIWQCDVNGRYLHGGDNRVSPPRDDGFQGFGRAVCDEQGRWVFRTIKPVSYPGRTPHIHFRVDLPDGRRLTTQMYVMGEAQNARDFLYQSIPSRLRSAVTVELKPRKGGNLEGFFPIVV